MEKARLADRMRQYVENIQREIKRLANADLLDVPQVDIRVVLSDMKANIQRNAHYLEFFDSQPLKAIVQHHEPSLYMEMVSTWDITQENSEHIAKTHWLLRYTLLRLLELTMNKNNLQYYIRAQEWCNVISGNLDELLVPPMITRTTLYGFARYDCLISQLLYEIEEESDPNILVESVNVVGVMNLGNKLIELKVHNSSYHGEPSHEYIFKEAYHCLRLAVDRLLRVYEIFDRIDIKVPIPLATVQAEIGSISHTSAYIVDSLTITYRKLLAWTSYLGTIFLTKSLFVPPVTITGLDMEQLLIRVSLLINTYVHELTHAKVRLYGPYVTPKAFAFGHHSGYITEFVAYEGICLSSQIQTESIRWAGKEYTKFTVTKLGESRMETIRSPKYWEHYEVNPVYLSETILCPTTADTVMEKAAITPFGACQVIKSSTLPTSHSMLPCFPPLSDEDYNMSIERFKKLTS